MIFRKIFAFLLISLLACQLFAQDKYWLTIGCKGGTSEAVKLNPLYQESLSKIGADIIIYSSWLNAISVYLSEEQLDLVESFDWIRSIQPVETLYIAQHSTDSILDLDDRKLEALRYKAFKEAGLDGSNVKIGVLDAGFLNYKESSIAETTIGGTRNFIEPEAKDLSSAKIYDFNEERPSGLIKVFQWFKAQVYHSHGTTSSELISGGSRYAQNGLAPKAILYLGKTEEGLREYKAEEDYWIAGLEWLHENGVRLVNTSLGYTKKREEKSNNYKPSDMNGTSMIARAAQMAVNEKDMILVISAGNEGGKPFWRIISTPADAKDVISVGATKPHSFKKERYSSIGPEFLDYVKPDVSAISPNGTSFSAPLITGFIACMLQQNPDLSSEDVKNLLERSCQLYPYKNNYIGYGLPQADKVLTLLDDPDVEVHNSQEVRVSESKYTFKKEYNKFITVFHKKDAYFVKHQERIEVENGTFVVKRKKGAKRTTILHGRKVIEIFWI